MTAREGGEKNQCMDEVDGESEKSGRERGGGGGKGKLR